MSVNEYHDIMAIVKERLHNWQLSYDDKTDLNKIVEENREYVHGIVDRIIQLHDHARSENNRNDNSVVTASFSRMETLATELVSNLHLPFPARKFSDCVLWARVSLLYSDLR